MVSYESGGALLSVFIPRGAPADAPLTLLGSVGGSRRGKTSGKREGNKAASVLAAVKSGASKPAMIAKKSGVDKKLVHAYLAYHKRRGNVVGDAASGYRPG